MENLSLIELKKLAKGRRIKMYYTKSIHELRWLLSQEELPMKYKIEKFTIKELRAQAQAKGIRGFWNLSRGDLVKLLYPDGTNQEDNNSQENSEQQSDHGSDVGV